MIAGTAKVHRETMVTINVRYFNRIEGVTVESYYAIPAFVNGLTHSCAALKSQSPSPSGQRDQVQDLMDQPSLGSNPTPTLAVDSSADPFITWPICSCGRPWDSAVPG